MLKILARKIFYLYEWENKMIVAHVAYPIACDPNSQHEMFVWSSFGAAFVSRSKMLKTLDQKLLACK